MIVSGLQKREDVLNIKPSNFRTSRGTLSTYLVQVRSLEIHTPKYLQDLKSIKKVNRYIGMACQKGCKQGRDDIIVKVNLQLKPHPCIVFTLVCNCNVKRCRDRAL